MFFDKNKLRLAFSHSVKKEDRLFADIYGYGNIKKLFRMALESNHACSILFTGPPCISKDSISTVTYDSKRFPLYRL